MNTKNRIKIFLTLAVVVSISAAAMAAMTVSVTPYGQEAGQMYTLAGETVLVDLHITDAVTDVNDLEFRWDSTYYDDPNYVKTFTQVDSEDPNVWEISVERPEEATGTKRYDFYCYVTDDNEEKKSGVMRIYFYDDACLLAKGFDPDAVALTDLNADCTTNLADFAILATAWMKDTTPVEPFPIGG